MYERDEPEAAECRGRFVVVLRHEASDRVGQIVGCRLWRK